MKPRLKQFAKDAFRATTGRLADAVLPPAKKLVIFSRGRTGSNFLVSLLKSHPDIRLHGEIVGQYFLQNAFITNEVNRRGAVAYFERAIRRVFFERVVGVKFLYYQLEEEYAREWNVPSVLELPPALQARKDLHVLHIKRRNLLATLVSWKVAQRTQQWHRRDDTPSNAAHDRQKVPVSIEECEFEFAQAERWQEFYDTAFTDRPFLSMDYEDLAANTETETARVLRFLGLPPRELASPMRKQIKRPLSDVVENFEELKTHFAGTRHAAFFEDDD